MTFTEVPGTTVTYNQDNPTETVWDGGASKWDVIGNTVTSFWDTSTTNYTRQSGASTPWTEK